MSSDDYKFGALSVIKHIDLIPTYNIEEDSFLMKIKSNDENLFEKNLLNNVEKGMNTWQKNFFVNQETEDSITFCPGPNIDQLLFSNGLNYINTRQLDLYTLQWIFSVAMGIFILHSYDISYQELTDQTVFIDTKLNARLLPFSRKINKGSTMIPEKIYYFSPEQIKDYELPQSKLDKNQKKMSDIYMYGVFLHELVTRRKHYNQYFDNLSIFGTNAKLKSGAIEYMNLSDEKSIPFLDLLYKCLDPDPYKRCSIEEIIKYLLNIDQYKQSSSDNDLYFNIANVDIDKYHQFIIDIIGFKQQMNYESCKNQIYNIMKQKFEPETTPKTNKCTFEDLKEGYSNGLVLCLNIVDQFLSQFNDERKEEYEEYKYKNPQVDEFDILKAYIKYQKDPNQLEDELNNLKSSNEYYINKGIGKPQAIDDKVIFTTFYNLKYNTFFTKMETPSNLDHQVITNFFKTVERMNPWEQNFFVKPSRICLHQSFTYCPGQNIYSFIFHNEKQIDKKTLNLYILEWLYSIAMAISILHTKGLKYLALTDKLIFIDSQMKARVLSLAYSLDKQLSTTPYRCLFYAPERYDFEFNDLTITDDLIEKSDVFTFGLIALEMVTKKKHQENLKNLAPSIFSLKLKEGPIKYLNLDTNEDRIPLYSIIKRCLKNDPSDRCFINEVVDYFLNLQPPQPSDNSNSESSEFDLSNVDFDEFHRFIIDVHNLDPKEDYEKAKLEISQIINQNNQDENYQEIGFNTILRGNENVCSFADLEMGSKLGIAHCDTILNYIESMLPQKVLEIYKNFTDAKEKLNKFDVMRICFDNQDNIDLIDKLLNDLLNKYKIEGHFIGLLLNMDNDHNLFKKFESPEYIELPYELMSESFNHVVQPLYPYKNRIPSYKYLNLFNFLYGEMKSPVLKDINTLTKLNWLLSVAKGIEEIHQRGCCMVSFSSKNVYIDENLNAILFMPKTIKMNSIDDQKFTEDLKTKFSYEFDDDVFDANTDISFFYRPPELFRTSIQKVNRIQCDIYSFGVLAKELIEFNLPWLLTENLSKWEKLKTIENPHWRHFSESPFKFFIESSEILNLIEILNNSLEIEPEKRGSFKEICKAISKITESQNQKSDKPIFYTTKYPADFDFSKFKNANKKVRFESAKKTLINQNYIKNQLEEANDRVNRCKSKVYTANLTLGSIPYQGARQIVMRQLYNTNCNTELTYLIKNSFGIPNSKALTMKSIFDALNDFHSQSLLTQPYGTNKKGDAIMKVSHFNQTDE